MSYFEVHVLIDQGSGLIKESHALWAHVDSLCAEHGWWSSRVSAEGQGGDGEEGQIILTNRYPRHELAVEGTKSMVFDARHVGLTIRRYKVEHAVLDSKVADELDLLR